MSRSTVLFPLLWLCISESATAFKIWHSLQKSPLVLKKGFGTFERELLAAYLGVEHFRHLAEPTRMLIYIDYLPLLSAFRYISNRDIEREIHQLKTLSQLNVEFRQIKSSHNPAANICSRYNQKRKTSSCNKARTAAQLPLLQLTASLLLCRPHRYLCYTLLCLPKVSAAILYFSHCATSF